MFVIEDGVELIGRLAEKPLPFLALFRCFELNARSIRVDILEDGHSLTFRIISPLQEHERLHSRNEHIVISVMNKEIDLVFDQFPAERGSA